MTLQEIQRTHGVGYGEAVRIRNSQRPKEFTLRGNPRNTFNGHQVQCKIVTDSREKAFQIFRNIFPSCNPCFCMDEKEVAA